MPEKKLTRLEAAFLLLALCPKCGANCRVVATNGWDIWCPIHQIVSTWGKLDLWNALEPNKGVYEKVKSKK